ncbi:YbaB/EbfC family nucleoid-associated protein [Lipingzhangella sp. LS1_29]|uniref:Nucleoid-associated protein RIF23_14120 n=1 Tax=Lipingzhangella rawalii TaxID=2055835 RepID=A0ABU2H7Z8_9ACTN|nr:YbaB/EbfC family nucleoid-associated protein [Lipingzhangella rawalii]MDS1271433.1 YbaB/EbfC family nucleoid-associated protein [Lipingzhangella rawalii]
MNMQAILQQAQQMQQQLMTAQQELAEAQLQGSAGGGLVTATVSGRGEVQDISISAEAIDPADTADSAQTIADLVLAAIRDAEQRVEELQQEKMGPLSEGLGGGMPGGMPGIPGM